MKSSHSYSAPWWSLQLYKSTVNRSREDQIGKKMVSSTIKAVLISTGITVMALFLKASVPIALDLFLSLTPILWSSFLSWLKPPYLFVVINVIITIIVASSSYHGGEDDESSPRWLEVKDVDLDADFVATFPPPIVVAEVDRSEVVYEEKEEEEEEDEISGLINGGDESVVLTSELHQAPPVIEESENLSPAEKPPVTDRSGQRKPVKASPKGGKKRKALRVAKPKRYETTLENTWKIITDEGKSTSLTSQYRRSDTFVLGAGAGETQPALRKAVTFRDMTNYQKPPTVTTPVKMKKEMSPSRDELNRRVEAFIKKCKEERLESMRLDKDLS
ncbi:unnamed protein product [Thlaspi arvense]|uniref:DUF4408 domain-containing protein n=1 Tax=Thlaspi arvense TaxID=13288 RepID=A0AAU9RC85_THLAR|nr:unnamed protein product [Thlaspi arvense]